MDTGMLWFDNNLQEDIESKIDRAAILYQQKYGRKPDLCFVHPSLLKKSSPRRTDMEIRAAGMVLPDYLWLGLKDPALP